MNIFYYLILKIVHLILYLLREKHEIVKKLYDFVAGQTKWWTLIVAIMEINAVDLVFAGSVQSLKLSSGSSIDKFNLCVMFLLIFTVLFYAQCFYCLVYANEDKNTSKNLLVYSKEKRMKSHFFEPLIFLARSIAKSFVHGYLINSYSTQIVVLLIIDVIFLIICLYMAKNFRNLVISVLVILYLLGFLLFDLYFVLENHTEVTT